MLIGIVGAKGSGKSTVSSYLNKKHDFKEHAVADPLKRICTILGAPYVSLYGTQEEKEKIIPSLGVSGRTLMQTLGTEVFRNTFPKVLPNFNMGDAKTIWVHLLDVYLSSHIEDDVVISDVRFSDEAEMIKKHGGILIRLYRNEPKNEYNSISVWNRWSSKLISFVSLDYITTKKASEWISWVHYAWIRDRHASELSIDTIECDYTITNDSDMNSLLHKVECILHEN